MKKKKLIILIVTIIFFVVCVVCILLATGVLGNKNEEYRVVSVDSYEGDVKLERNLEEEELFEGMHLGSNDKISTGVGANILLLADSDKHILAKENTCFTINTTGDSNKGKIIINLEYGTSLITIDNKLEEGSEFEVDTPNASLSVRGTTFEVTYNLETEETLLTVKEGCVEVVNDILSKLINTGESVIITDEDILYIDEDIDASDESDVGGDTEATDSNSTPSVDLSILADGVDEEEWPLILKNDVDIKALKYCLGIMTKCKIDGHENYVAEALIDLDTNIYYKEPFKIIGGFQMEEYNYEWFQVYYVSELNNVYGLMPEGTINESNIPEDAQLTSKYVYINVNAPDELCVPTDVDMESFTSYMGENYYLPCPMEVSIENVDASQPDKITVEYTFMLNDKDGNVIHEKSPFVAYLEPDESGRYVITSIDKN